MLLRRLALTALIGWVLVLVPTLWIRAESSGRVVSVTQAPAADVAIVFGAQLAPGGQEPMTFLRHRLDTAAVLTRILARGSHRTWDGMTHGERAVQPPPDPAPTRILARWPSHGGRGDTRRTGRHAPLGLQATASHRATLPDSPVRARPLRHT